MVNHKKIKDPAEKIHPEKDRVTLNGKPVTLPKTKLYMAFNKPRKVLTSMSDPKNRLCISDYFKAQKERIFPVGRLDWHSEGLILLTNDGDFAKEVLHQKIPKTYLVKIKGRVSTEKLSKFKKGVFTEKGRLKALYVKSLRNTKVKQYSWIKIILEEGKNRQLHRMFEKIGFQIKVLRRTGIGRLKLRSLKPGEHFCLSPRDIDKIFSLPLEIQKKSKN